MGARDGYKHGTFSWTDLTTPTPGVQGLLRRAVRVDFEDNPIPG